MLPPFFSGRYEENVAPPEVKELTSKGALEEACQHSLCVIAVLPQLLDCQSRCRNSYLDILKAQAEKFKKSGWGWIWAEALAQPEVEKAFEIGGFGYPAMVVANVKKQKFSTLRGSFDEPGIHEFLR
ncbi:unnamed protein product [Cyprideis torosa]|uniref:protein disulfide-isomerase n=1 Tax=Cyprideis torosa TaxID=163714 RepID=A0A7R8WRI0_9CRUS|nr:unnamed protein product [Cyprideis torosa]CAG0904197.1 unnamed protein product [Cyprideis torosa]